MSKLSEELRRIFEEKALDPKEVYFDMRIDYAVLYRLLKGEREPRDETLWKLAQYEPLGLSYLTLKGWQLEDKLGFNPLEPFDNLFKIPGLPEPERLRNILHRIGRGHLDSNAELLSQAQQELSAWMHKYLIPPSSTDNK